VSADLPLVRNPLQVVAGRVGVGAATAPGLGVDIDEAVLGDPLAVLE
jgi:hypothetical protein